MGLEEYKLEISAHQLSIKPYFAYMTKVKWFTLLSVLIFITIPFIKDKVAYNIWTTGYAIGSILVFYLLYHYIFHVNVMFLFDRNTRSIYKINTPFLKKRLMSFEEMTIINISTCGAVEYAIGQKKKQFLKNYAISDTFTNSKKSQEREQKYIEKILNPILEFVAHT